MPSDKPEKRSGIDGLHQDMIEAAHFRKGLMLITAIATNANQGRTKLQNLVSAQTKSGQKDSTRAAQLDRMVEVRIPRSWDRLKLTERRIM